jgi:hypothetical protein
MPAKSKAKSVKSKSVKSILPKTTNKNGKPLTSIQRMNAVGLRNNGRSNMSQQQKMKAVAQTYKECDGMYFAPESQLPSYLNEMNPK